MYQLGKLEGMTTRAGVSLAALCGGATVVALAISGAGESPINAKAPTTSVAAKATSAVDNSDGAALPVEPAGGGGGCIIGLNCGPINPPHPVQHHYPITATTSPHPAVKPQNP